MIARRNDDNNKGNMVPSSTTEADFDDRINLSIEDKIIRSSVADRTSGTTAPILTAGPCSSSMDVAWNLVEQNIFPHWTSLLVERQWAGKGQHRNVWYSPPGNLYTSIRLPETQFPWHTMTSLLVGGMVLDFLKYLGLEVELKWPNDLLIHRKKIGGVLVEERSGVTIAGIGLNIDSAPSLKELGSSHSMPAAYLKEFGIDLSPEALWIRLIKKGIPWFQKVTAPATTVDFIETIERSLAFVGEKVVVAKGDSPAYPATLTGLHPRGGLKLKGPAGRQTIYSGTVYPIIM